MAGTGQDSMTSLMVLLSLGLSVGASTPVQEGTFPRPTLWAEPDSLVPFGSSVTFWCQGTLEAQEFRLNKAGSLSAWDMQFPLESGNKAKFSVSYIIEAYAGTYRCYYHSPAGWSEHSDPLELVVTGLYSKPSLSALPSPGVASGGTVTLQCGSDHGFDTFVLTHGGDPESPWKLCSQQLPSGHFQALFDVGPVKPGLSWSFRCYGFFSHTPQQWSHSSVPLQLLFSGPPGDPSPHPTNPELTTGGDARGLLSSGTGGIQCQGSEEPSLIGPCAESSSMEFPKGSPGIVSPKDEDQGQQGASPRVTQSQTIFVSSTASQPRDYTVENRIRLGISGFILLVLGILLLDAWLSQRKYIDQLQGQRG